MLPTRSGGMAGAERCGDRLGCVGWAIVVRICAVGKETAGPRLF